MLIIALVLALIGLVALVFAVVTSNELVAWVCIGASVLGVVLLIIDALRERQRRDAAGDDLEEDHGPDAPATEQATLDYPEDSAEEAEHTGVHEPTAQTTTATEAGEEPAVPAEGRRDDRAT